MELALSRITGERFAAWITRVYEGRTSNEISPLKSRKSIGKETTFDYDRENYRVVLENLLSIVRRVMKSAREIGVSGRLAEIKIRYTGFETHTHGRCSIPVSMNDDEVFTSLAEKLFANNVQTGKKIRLIGFRLGHLDTPTTKQTRLLSLIEEE